MLLFLFFHLSLIQGEGFVENITTQRTIPFFTIYAQNKTGFYVAAFADANPATTFTIWYRPNEDETLQLIKSINQLELQRSILFRVSLKAK